MTRPPYVYHSIFTPEQNALLAGMNFDEEKVAPYTLPPLLQSFAGEAITSIGQWEAQRKPELLARFRQKVYGEMFPATAVEGVVTESSNAACGGTATRYQIALRFPEFEAKPRLRLIVYLPNAAAHPVPCFLGLCFTSNAAAFDDPAIPLSAEWFPEGFPGVVENRETEASRATATRRWPLKEILARGYAVATLYYGELEEDHFGGFPTSVRAFFQKEGIDARLPHEPGAITSWAWGLSRVLDYLERMPEIDSRRVALTGHSRLGKTALWAAANDERIAMVIANQSGCGGAAISKRNFGETYPVLSNVRTYWFCEACRKESGETDFPLDQHQLLALIAPRPVLVASTTEDSWLSEYLGVYHAAEAYRLFGHDGPETSVPPPAGERIFTRIGFGLREGKHDIISIDWAMHLDFADRYLRL